MNESFIAIIKLLISDQKLPEPVEPGVRRFHDPTPVLRWAPASALLSCDPGSISPGTDLFASRFSIISLIRIQESLLSFEKGNDSRIKHGDQLTDVMSVGPGNDQRQRDATAVHQDMSLASLFSPGLWDSDRLLPELGEL